MSNKRCLLHVCLPLALVALSASCGGSSDGSGSTNPPPPATTATVEITPSGSITLDALQATQPVSATAKSSSGGTVSASFTWASDAPTIASVPSSGGSVTAVAKGTAHITARADNGVTSSPLTVVVQQKEAQLVAISGNAQVGTVGTAVGAPLVVQANDRNGNPVGGASVTFATTTGTVGSATATTGANGQATTTWTLPTVAGNAAVTAALASSPSTTVAFTATARAGAAQKLVKVDGDAQRGSVSAALGAPIVAQVTDQFNNPVAGVSMSFAVTGGGGSVSGSSVTSGANGQGSITWTLGSNEALAQTLAVSSSGLTPISYSATALRASVGGLGPTPFRAGCHISTIITGVTAADASHISATFDGVAAPAVSLTNAGGQFTLSITTPTLARATDTFAAVVIRVYSQVFNQSLQYSTNPSTFCA